uniref:hypothetical protein n=1 Tax=Clostridium sp. NkU-1 TaxID=1095009 RepID=UPI0006CF8B19
MENLVQKIYSNFTALSTEMAKLRSSIYERPIVTEDSFLVCRCGGIIKVVQNGSWINISKNRIESNIIDLIRHADKTLYEKCIERLNSSMSNDYKFSAIKAFNIVHGILIYATGTEKQNRDYIKDKECEEAHKPAPHVEITLRPARDVLKQAKYGEVAANAVTFFIWSLFMDWDGCNYCFIYGKYS